MNNELWFKAKKNSWLWTPINNKGWATILGYGFIIGGYPLFCGLFSLFYSFQFHISLTILLTIGLAAVISIKGGKPVEQRIEHDPKE